MADPLFHSCSTCEGTGYDPHSRMANRRPCPDCIDGYPKAAVERAAKAIYGSGLPTASFDKMGRQIPFEESMSPQDFIDGALAAIRAFHNEGSEQ